MINILFLPQVNPSLVAVLAISVFTVISIKGGKRVDLAAILSFILVFAIIGIVSTTQGLDFSNFQPFMPNGFYPGVLSGAMYTFSMYVGMRAIATQSPVMKEPGKVLPIAVLLSTLISIIVYSSIAFVAVGVVPLNSGTSDPLLIQVGVIVMGPIGKALVGIAWISAALMSLATSMTVQTSIISALSRDGYLPRILFSSDRSSRNKYVIQMIGALLAILFAATGLIVFVGYAAGFASLLVYAIVNLSLMKLRKEKPDLDRPFKTPLYPYTPIVGIFIALLLMIFVEGSAILLVLEFSMILLIVYHLRMIGYRRLRLAIAGINLGVSGIITLILFLLQTGTIKLGQNPQEQATLVFFGSILGATFLIAGILNLFKSKKEEIEKIEKPWNE
jgi:APA family basic amino acid/polyamine antiporter